MRISDSVANYILELLNQAGGIAEIQRNELASFLGCVPSQINYVLTSRFTPEQGYIVESRRGGGGYIRITRLKLSKADMIMHIINGVGDSLDGLGPGYAGEYGGGGGAGPPVCGAHRRGPLGKGPCCGAKGAAGHGAGHDMQEYAAGD